MISIFKRLRGALPRYAVFLFVVGCGSAVQVTSSAAETGLVRQVFACHYVNGAGQAELLAVRDKMVANLPAIGLPPAPAFLWTPYKGTSQYDVLWFDNFENLNAWGAEQDIWDGSAVAAEVDAAYDEVIECESGLSIRQTVYEGGEPLTVDPPALISSSACALREGKNFSHVESVLASVKTTLDGLGIHKSAVTYMSVPVTGGSEIDLYFYSVHPDVSTYAARTTALRTSEAGQRLGAQFRSVLDCQNSLWWGEQIVAGAEEE